MIEITVHRGAHQIGGCITAIATAHCRIIIDLGSNLPGSEVEEFSAGDIKRITAGADALFYTHFHGDHVGLFHLVPEDIPQYIGEGAKEVMQCKYKALRMDHEQLVADRMLTFQKNHKMDIGGKGEIFVTPYYVSHSAFDAYMFKIECEGRTILHMGDFRGHGYLSRGLLPTLKTYVGQVDILITEGTMLGRRGEKVLDELQVQNRIADYIRQHKYTFVLTSSTDMERLLSLHNASKRVGRHFWVDRYQEEVLGIFNKYNQTALFKFDTFFSYRGFDSPLVVHEMKRKGFLMPVRLSCYDRVSDMLQVYNDEPAWLIYSMWNGYAEQDKPYTSQGVLAMRELFGQHIADGTRDGVHTSGHADVETIAEVCRTVRPRLGIIPIHKDKNTSLDSVPGLEEYTVFTDEHCTVQNVNMTLK